MKSLHIFLILLAKVSFCSAQNTGTIKLKSEKQRNETGNQYAYTPPKNLLIPTAIEALILYINKGVHYKKFIPALKINNEYVFSFRPPDSTSVLIIGIVDAQKNMTEYAGLLAAKKTILDNNNNAGFIFYQFDKTGNRFPFEKIQLATLLLNYARSKLDVRVSTDSIVKLYEDAFELHPELIEKDEYLDYLNTLYTAKGDVAKEKLLLYAKKMDAAQNDETKWLTALSLFEQLNMENEKNAVERKVLTHFPNGELARQNFWDRFYSSEQNEFNSEEKILAGMTSYSVQFNDSSPNLKDKFYSKIVSQFLIERKFVKILNYDSLFLNKFILARYYNKAAAELLAGNIERSDANVRISQMFSRRAINYASEYLNNLLPDYEYRDEVLAEYHNYISTYALALFVQEKYDSAFYYQDIVYRHGYAFNKEFIGRYVLFAEQVKGISYVKEVLEQQIDKGIGTPEILKQLQTIYQQLKLPEHEFEGMVAKAEFRLREESERKIKAQFGTLKASDFVLKDLSGKEVSLSSYKDKVVVMVFWSTWCVPCRASFPSLQKMIDKYANDNEVVFLFIDVWENKPFKRMQEAALKIVKEKNYSFNILFDSDDTVVKNYKIKGVPMKFILDKRGNIIFMGDTVNLIPEIENAKR